MKISEKEADKVTYKLYINRFLIFLTWILAEE